jgi:uncharacterized protein DUF6434/SAP domain-containing protein
MSRPELDRNITIKSFKDYYWLIKELISFCRMMDINSTGGKLEISDRIVKFLEKGEIVARSGKQKAKTDSSFDWKNEDLKIHTLITDNYSNTKNVRAFFINAIGKHFRFNVAFMNWMKSNSGRTLGDAIEKWKQIADLKKDKTYVSEIAPQFEYNTYMRDFLRDNPGLSSKDAIECWKIKKSKAGNHKYERPDVDFLRQR